MSFWTGNSNFKNHTRIEPPYFERVGFKGVPSQLLIVHLVMYRKEVRWLRFFIKWTYTFSFRFLVEKTTFSGELFKRSFVALCIQRPLGSFSYSFELTIGTYSRHLQFSFYLPFSLRGRSQTTLTRRGR